MATVPEIITDQQITANNYLTQAQGFIDKVANLANTEFTVSIPASLGFGLTDYTDDALDKINNLRPVKPIFDDIEVLSPTAPIISFADIDQSILNQVKAKLATDLADGGYGIDTNDEAMLVQRERDREDSIALSEADEITRAFAEGGFPLPPGAMFNARERALQNRGNKLSSVNRDIALRRAQLYVENRQFAITQAQNVQQVLVALHRLFVDQAQAILALFQSQIQKYRADVDADVEVLRANLGIYTADVQAFNASISAIAEAYRLKNSEHQLNNAWNIQVVRSKLEEAELQLRKQVSSATVRNSAAQYGAQYYLGAITAALGSINTLAAQTATDS